MPVRPRPAGGLEFLLVRTSDGARRTFPKGGCEPGESLAQAAAREALEEGGVAGRVGAGPLGRYRYGEDDVTAFLLEVQREGPPAEVARDPVWLGLEGARSALAAGHESPFGEQMERLLLAAQRAAGSSA